MSQPPRVPERLLDGLSGRTPFSEGVIGDLAEEFARRAARDSAGSARRWYYRESMRTIPHLLRDWIRNAGWRETADIAASVVVVWMTLVGLGHAAAILGFPARAVQKIFYPRPIAFGWEPDPVGTVPVVILWMVVIGVLMLSGAIAAWRSTRAPIIAAGAVAIAWALLDWRLFGFGNLADYAVLRHPNVAMALYWPLTTLGGIIQIARFGRRRRGPTPSRLALGRSAGVHAGRP
jgi:hypothetical protein